MAGKPPGTTADPACQERVAGTRAVLSPRASAGHNEAVPRANRPQRPPHVPLRSAAHVRAESAVDGEWVVRSVPGSPAASPRPPKPYRCPGCDQLIPADVGHLVTWPAGEYGSVAERRHWHTPCWAARAHRRPPDRRRR